jgi:putative addiction module component (TIGR02574 family)
MSVAEIEKQILDLPEDERRQLVDWVYDHEREIVGDVDDDGLSPEQNAELERRLKEIDEHPERLVPWEGTIERLRERLYAVQNRKNRAS